MMKLIYLTLVLVFFTFGKSYSNGVNGDPIEKNNTTPVVLTEFTHSTSIIGNIDFEWSIKSETTFSHFEIELSQDLASWEKAATINSAEAINMDNYTTSIPSVSYTRFARLKMIYSDGNFEYSDTRLLVGEIEDQVEVQQSSNPHFLQLNMEDITEAEATNATGETTDLKVLSNQSIDVNNVKPGFYLLKLKKKDGNSETLKYLKF